MFWERPDSTHTQYAYISVFCPKATYYAPLGRTIIRYKNKGKYDCKCNDQKIGCIHKRMGLLHIFKNYRSILKDLKPQQELESENDEHLQVRVQRDQALLDRYIQYLCEKNKHFHIPEALNMLPSTHQKGHVTSVQEILNCKSWWLLAKVHAYMMWMQWYKVM